MRAEGAYGIEILFPTQVLTRSGSAGSAKLKMKQKIKVSTNLSPKGHPDKSVFKSTWATKGWQAKGK